MGLSPLAVHLQIECPAWRKAWPRASVEVRALLRVAAKRPELDGAAQGEVAVVFADDAKLRGLNARFRGKDRPTNVLSFGDPGNPLGGIALAFETVLGEAKAQGKPFANHSKHLILHGFLHLLGYDHARVRDARLMEGLEIAILSDMGIPNPYLVRTKTRA
jgi:probable rRNA maturation factor